MRQLSEINKDIEEIDGKIKVLRAQREILSDERRERMFADFCHKYGVKKGDVVHTNRYGDMMVCGIDARWGDWIQIRKIKKNGEPYSVFNTQSQSVFDGCKVIGHIDDWRMGEDAKLFINQGIRIMVGDKPVGFAKEGMLTYNIEDDGSTKDSGAWGNPMRHSYEITGEAVVTNVGDPIRELLEDMPSKVDVEIRREMGKMPRKMKKAYRIGDRYQRDTKWKRKAKAYARRFVYRLPNAEMVVTREQMGVLEATIKGSSLQYNPDAVAHVSGKDIAKAMAAYVRKR